MRALLMTAALAAIGGRLEAAKTDSAVIRVRIQDIFSFSATNGGTIALAGTAGSNVLSGAPDTTGRINLSHNLAAAARITAEVRPSGNPTGHDITLTAAVAGGLGAKTLVLSGAAQPVQTLASGIAAGALSNRTITYTASCTASGTIVSADATFTFTVTFTAVDP